MSTPTIANANSSDFLKSEFFNMLRDIDYPVYHGDDEPVDAPSAAPPADMSFDFDELEAMIDMPTNIKTGPNAVRLVLFPEDVRETWRADLVERSNGLHHGAANRTNDGFWHCHWQHEIDGVKYKIYMQPQYTKQQKIRQWQMMVPCYNYPKDTHIALDRKLYVAYLHESDSAFGGAAVTKKVLWQKHAANKKRDIYKPGEARPTYTTAPRKRRRPSPAAAVEAEPLLDL